MKRIIARNLLIWLCLELILTMLLIVTASYWVLGTMMFIVLLPLISWLWNGLALRTLQCTAQLPAASGKEFSVCGTVTVRGKLPVAGKVYARLTVKNDLTGESTAPVVELMPGKEGYQAGFDLTSRYCGRVRLFVEELTALDSFGFLPMRRTEGCGARMAVMPETFPVDISADFASAASAEADSYHESRRGDDPSEIRLLREYQPGDELKGIHWKLSSKLDTLIYRERSQPIEHALLLYWDRRGSSAAVADALAESVFSLAQAMCEAGIPFTLGWAEDGMVRLEQISNQELLLQYLPSLLRRKNDEDVGLDTRQFGKVFYFTGNVPEEISSGTTVFLCQENGQGLDGTVSLTPDNYKEILQRLDFE